MDWVRNWAEWVWHHRMTAYVVVLSVAFVVVVTVVRAEQVRTDDLAAATALQTEINSKQTDAITAIVHELEIETQQRTTQSCEASRITRETSRETFFGIFDAVQPTNPDGSPKPSPALDHLRQVVEQKLPPLTCPTDQSIIVIPTPSTTAPGG